MKPKILILTGLLIIALALIAMTFRGPQDTESTTDIRHLEEITLSIEDVPVYIKDHPASGTVYDPKTWATYRNEELGFELKHPKDWVVVEEETDTGSMVRFGPYREDVINMPWWGVEMVENVSLDQAADFLQKKMDVVAKVNNFLVQYVVSTTSPKQFKGKEVVIVKLDETKTSWDSFDETLIVFQNKRGLLILPWAGMRDDRMQYDTLFYTGLLNTLQFVD